MAMQQIKAVECRILGNRVKKPVIGDVIDGKQIMSASYVVFDANDPDAISHAVGMIEEDLKDKGAKYWTKPVQKGWAGSDIMVSFGLRDLQ